MRTVNTVKYYTVLSIAINEFVYFCIDYRYTYVDAGQFKGKNYCKQLYKRVFIKLGWSILSLHIFIITIILNYIQLNTGVKSYYVFNILSKFQF